jgi:hypothetical protein
VLSGRSTAWLALGGMAAVAASFEAEAALAFAIGLAGGLSLAGSV